MTETDTIEMTVTFTVEAVDCKEAIEQVDTSLGDSNDLAIDRPTVDQVVRQ